MSRKKHLFIVALIALIIFFSTFVILCIYRKSHEKNDDAVIFTYGLHDNGGDNSRMQLDFCIEWSDKPAVTSIDEFDILWYVADIESKPLLIDVEKYSCKAYIYADSGEFIEEVDEKLYFETAGKVSGKIKLDRGLKKYTKKIIGTITLKTRSNSKNMESVQIFAKYVHDNKVILDSNSTIRYDDYTTRECTLN